MKSQILGRRLQICYLNFQGNQESCHGNQIQKNKPKLHKFLFLARNRGIFRMFSRVLWAL